ncbi:28S ribosomal protein S18b, mitochondrial isoform X1 [Hypomesus transpacificus]|uniref:28S ribosomal protein S18b, mitochondrial isoform X1 n=1 Tax=Hypomesus transpacificus TaxID=137520 RepID=UPI001F07554F|nr:28S ribosomal protein S18b, mitochondrial isoform X1 [Hypomesus transpacificus]
MAASVRGIGRIFSRVSPLFILKSPHSKKFPVRIWFQAVSPFLQPGHYMGTKPSLEGDNDALNVSETQVRFKDRPWDYLESEEYIERYGSSPVWADYRRNHKGGIPPQKTRKTCIRGSKICGNACPICRDPNVIIHYQNVKLLQQFISPYTGIVYDPTRTGVCMKQQKQLQIAINTAQDHGLIPFQVPYVDFTGEDYSNSHDAVGCTSTPSALAKGEAWYKWYHRIEPDEKELSKIKRLYKAYLK